MNELNRTMLELREIYVKQLDHPYLRSALRSCRLEREDWSRIDEFMNYGKSYKDDFSTKELFNMFVSLARFSRKAYTDVTHQLKKLVEKDDKSKLIKAGYASENEMTLQHILIDNFPRNVQFFSRLLLQFHEAIVEKDFEESLDGSLVGLSINDMDQNYHALELMVAKLDYAGSSQE